MQITEMLRRVCQGDETALDSLIPFVYEELKKLAAGHLRREGMSKPIETTALVHEAFLRLAGGAHPSYENRAHFYGIASRLMRQVLVDMGRARMAAKRSAGSEVTLTGIGDMARSPDDTVLAVDEALTRLAQSSPVQAQLVEMRYFGGMTAEESASVLAISVHVARRQLRVAEAWLHKELAQ